jgi:hypothetical protein
VLSDAMLATEKHKTAGRAMKRDMYLAHQCESKKIFVASDYSISLLDVAESDHERRGREMRRRPSLTMTGSSDSFDLPSTQGTPTEVAIWKIESNTDKQHPEKDSFEEVPWHL